MIVKRIFDCIIAVIGLCVLGIPLFLFWLLASYDTSSNGLFAQVRIGQYGLPFVIYKLKTFHPKNGSCSRIGSWFRGYKIDEWPQLFNVLKGEMSLVGPRPDVPGYYDVLQGKDRKILEIKPGITSEASLKYRNEEQLLATQSDPLRYNDDVLFPDKVKMNLDYCQKRNFWLDLKIVWETFLLFWL